MTTFTSNHGSKSKSASISKTYDPILNLIEDSDSASNSGLGKCIYMAGVDLLHISWAAP